MTWYRTVFEVQVRAVTRMAPRPSDGAPSTVPVAITSPPVATLPFHSRRVVCSETGLASSGLSNRHADTFTEVYPAGGVALQLTALPRSCGDGVHVTRIVGATTVIAPLYAT